MGKLVVVGGDPVKGTDKHNVSGQATNPAPPPATVPYTGVGSFGYQGSMTDALSSLLRIGGLPAALVTSRSSLDPGQTAAGGGHAGPQGTGFTPAAPVPLPATLAITDTPLGTGVPSAGAGSALLTVEGVRVLIDADKIDTCSGVGATADSTVTARGQSFVTTD